MDSTTLGKLSRAQLQKVAKDHGVRANMKSAVIIRDLVKLGNRIPTPGPVIIMDSTTLGKLSRAQLQKVAKDHGVRANMKNVVIIRELVKVSKAVPILQNEESEEPPRKKAKMTVERHPAAGPSTRTVDLPVDTKFAPPIEQEDARTPILILAEEGETRVEAAGHAGGVAPPIKQEDAHTPILILAAGGETRVKAAGHAGGVAPDNLAGKSPSLPEEPRMLNQGQSSLKVGPTFGVQTVFPDEIQQRTPKAEAKPSQLLSGLAPDWLKARHSFADDPRGRPQRRVDGVRRRKQSTTKFLGDLAQSDRELLEYFYEEGGEEDQLRWGRVLGNR